MWCSFVFSMCCSDRNCQGIDSCKLDKFLCFFCCCKHCISFYMIAISFSYMTDLSFYCDISFMCVCYNFFCLCNIFFKWKAGSVNHNRGKSNINGFLHKIDRKSMIIMKRDILVTFVCIIFYDRCCFFKP